MMAIVIGPTPPGTGVIAVDLGSIIPKSTSPTNVDPDDVGLSTRLIPTSMTQPWLHHIGFYKFWNTDGSNQDIRRPTNI